MNCRSDDDEPESFLFGFDSVFSFQMHQTSKIKILARLLGDNKRINNFKSILAAKSYFNWEKTLFLFFAKEKWPLREGERDEME